MAEAYSLISLRISPDGFGFNYNFNVMNQIFRSILRSWKRRYGRLKNRFVNNVYPLSYRSLIVCLCFSAVISYLRIPTLYSLQLKVAMMSQKITRMSSNGIYTIFINGLLLWGVNILLFKYCLRSLLRYKGWVFDEPKNVTWQTKLWLFTLRCFVGNKMLKSYQCSLPRLPLPSLNDTVRRYLKSAQCVYDEDEMEELRSDADTFLATQGSKLQRYLRLKSWWSSNYVSDWWEEYIYLFDRSSIVINSNYYCLGLLGQSKEISTRQASRAAGVVSSLLHFRRQIHTENLEPLMVANSVPLCTCQYDKIFNTSRIAQPTKDKLQHFDVSNHISVSHRGKYYKVYIYCDSCLACASELERVFDIILNDTSDPIEGEEFVGVITAVDRDTSASLRRDYFSAGINRESITSIDRAAFHLVLEDIPADMDMHSDSERLSLIARKLYIGKGYDRWFEKSFNIVIFADGHVTLIAEHSWGDALVLSHMLESSTVYEKEHIQYGTDGRIISKDRPKCRLIDPIRLKFEFDNGLDKILEDHAGCMEEEVNNLDLRVFRFMDFGKNFGRNNKLSTDSLVQLALQLAYYRENGHFVNTYESASTRFFLEGRTETIRSCTSESCKFVKAMTAEDQDVETLRQLAREAIISHQNISRLALTGSGIDRHMFALFIVSKLLNQRSPFLERVIKEKWGISSSQTPLSQTANKISDSMAINSAGGGFGPTCFRGYGVAYFPYESIITFHVSCMRNSECRDATIFGKRIETAIRDIAQIISL